MKKQFFLLSLLIATANMALADSDCNSCDTSCNTSCNNSCDDSCDDVCVPEHGHTFMSLAPEFGAASPERVALFESKRLKDLRHHEKHGAMQVVVYGGQNTHKNKTAGYFLPYGHTSLTFDGSIKEAVFSRVLGETSAQVTDATAVGNNITVGGGQTPALPAVAPLQSDPASYKFDYNKDTSKILPWNFGITYAALFEPEGVVSVAAGDSGVDNIAGAGLVSNPAFKSTIKPCFRRWHVGAGIELTYHFSDSVDKGWYGRLSTAVQHVASRIALNETVETEKTLLNNDLADGSPMGDITGTAATNAFTFGTNPEVFNVNTVTTTAPVGSIKEAYIGSGFWTDEAGDVDRVAPANVEEAFMQAGWLYGKMGCDTKITRLADIELSLGYLWTCGDCATTSWELGLVIPTGNKPCPEFVAPAVVGNNQHAGIRTGSTTTVMISENDDSSTWFRLDIDGRYLFRNTQKRSFDLLGNEWSRYMMVWENKAAYEAAVAAINTNTITATPIASFLGAAQRTYTPGINVFTADFCVKPQFQGRVNNAVVMCGERFKAELGWNVHVRSKECVELSCGWDQAPAFADSSYIGGVGLNNNRTIYNDSQTTVVNAVTKLDRGLAEGIVPLANYGALSADAYDNFAISENDINYDSVATPAVISNTPYLALGYAFDYDWMPVLSVGASYEFTANNRALNQWMVWGKLAFAF